MQVTLRESSSILKDWRNGLDVDSVLRGQGADPAVIRSRSPAVVRFAERALEEGMPLLDPIVIYRRLPVESVRHERIALPGKVRRVENFISWGTPPYNRRACRKYASLKGARIFWSR